MSTAVPWLEDAQGIWFLLASFPAENTFFLLIVLFSEIVKSTLVFYNGCNKLQQTRWLKATEIFLSYSSGSQKFEITLMKLNQSISRATFPLKTLEKNPFSFLFHSLELNFLVHVSFLHLQGRVASSYLFLCSIFILSFLWLSLTLITKGIFYKDTCDCI